MLVSKRKRSQHTQSTTKVIKVNLTPSHYAFKKSENDLRSNARSHASVPHADAKHKNNENIAFLVDTPGKTKWIIHSDSSSHISNSKGILRWQTQLKLTS